MVPTHLKVFLVEAHDQLLIVAPQGDTEAFRYQEVHVETNAMLEFVRRNQPRRLLVDFSSVGLIGSLMFASLIKLARFFDSADKRACFCCASEPMQQSMQAMRLTSHWPHFDSREAALDYLAENN